MLLTGLFLMQVACADTFVSSPAEGKTLLPLTRPSPSLFTLRYPFDDPTDAQVAMRCVTPRVHLRRKKITTGAFNTVG